MGRLSQITSPNYPSTNQGYNVAVTASYTAASQLSSLQYGTNNGGPFTESRTYNTLMQITRMTTTNYQGTAMDMQYNYTAGQNNGRVASTTDNVLGETVNYTYDMWNRLSTATATNGTWGESYTFDNFGNLTGKTPTAGTAPSMSVPANNSNQPTGIGSFDANGNSLGGNPYYPNTWDVENRLVATATSTQSTAYSYDPWGRRMWKEIPASGSTYTTAEIYFIGVTGQKLETYSCTYTPGGFTTSLEGINIYFGKKLLQSKGAWVATDKLGTVRSNSSLGPINYFPYGEERTNTANGTEKFGTYTRDAVGQDYAEQRYYNSNMGAFWSPDRGGIKTADPTNPLSWNWYAYTKGDPIGRFNPHGLDDCCPDDPCGCDPCDPCSEELSSWNPAGGVQPADSCGPGLGLGGGPPTRGLPPSCSLELEYTGVKSLFGVVNHAALVITDSSGATFTIEGFLQSTLPPWGMLIETTISGNVNYTQWDTTLTSSEDSSLCSQIAAIETAMSTSNEVSYIGWGPNSNSFINWLLQSGGVSGYFTQPPKTPGWNMPLYGTLLGNPGKRRQPVIASDHRTGLPAKPSSGRAPHLWQFHAVRVGSTPECLQPT